MPAVDPKKLKKLLIIQIITPFAMRRRLSGGQLADLVERAMRDPRFDLSAASDDFAGYMNEAEAADWAEEFERSGKAPHLFSKNDEPAAADQNRFGGHTQEELEKMTPQQVLRIANEVEFEKHAQKKS